MLKKISWIALLSASVFSWVGSAEYSLEANSKNIISVSSFIQSLVPSCQKISSNRPTSVLQSLGRFLPLKYQKGINPSISCPYHIGDFAQGGVIIWLTHDGLHGLVAAIEDLEDGPEQKIQWSTTTDTTSAVSTLPLPFSTPSRPFNQYYGGFQNQETIEKISVWESKYPAFRAAANYSITIYGVEYADWFLPSQSEICLMYGAREIINKVSVEYGGSAMTLDGLGESYYWSSHEHKTEPTKAWVMDFDFGYANIKTKTEKHRARAIRAF